MARIAQGMAAGHRQKESVASKFAGPKPHGPPCLGCDKRPITSFKIITELKRSVAGDLGTADHQSCEKLHTTTEATDAKAGGGRFEHSK